MAGRLRNQKRRLEEIRAGAHELSMLIYVSAPKGLFTLDSKNDRTQLKPNPDSKIEKWNRLLDSACDCEEIASELIELLQERINRLPPQRTRHYAARLAGS